MPDLLNIDGSTLIGKAGITCDDKETAKARQSSYNLLDDAISEELLLTVAAQVVEWQDGDRRFVGKW